jgi:hypothetical protein
MSNDKESVLAVAKNENCLRMLKRSKDPMYLEFRGLKREAAFITMKRF